LESQKDLNQETNTENTFDWHDPPKSLKKKLRAIIEAGLRNEYERCIQKVRKIITECDGGKIVAGEAFYTIQRELKTQEKIIRRRYDFRGSQYCNIVLFQLIDRVISEEDLEVLGNDVKKFFLKRAERYSQV
jgi:hypothetical protein